MRFAILAVAITAIVVPAMAQQAGNQKADQKASSAQSTSQSRNMTAMSQDKLRKSLQQAGFKEINIVDAAYVVHAKTNDGQMVVMYIDPPSRMTGAAGASRSDMSQQEAAQPSTTMQQSK